MGILLFIIFFYYSFNVHQISNNTSFISGITYLWFSLFFLVSLARLLSTLLSFQIISFCISDILIFHIFLIFLTNSVLFCLISFAIAFLKFLNVYVLKHKAFVLWLLGFLNCLRDALFHLLKIIQIFSKISIAFLAYTTYLHSKYNQTLCYEACISIIFQIKSLHHFVN